MIVRSYVRTHDEKTENYFADSSVCVANVCRVTEGGGVGMVESAMAETVYTHHQKTVIADAEIPDTEQRRLVGFVGGVDLTDGRYDSPEFPLFDFAERHGTDFYQNCTAGATAETGPREPWQDIHARVEGPAVADLLENFTERWRKQAEDKVGHLLDLAAENIDPEAAAGGDEGCGGWSAQIYRSATSDSCVLDQDRVGLLTGSRGHLVDDSILRCGEKYLLYLLSLALSSPFTVNDQQGVRASDKECETLHPDREPVLHGQLLLVERAPRGQHPPHHPPRDRGQGRVHDRGRAEVHCLRHHPDVPRG